MNYGMYMSASGLLTSKYRQDVLTNNLANINTTGFKAHVPTVRFRQSATLEDGLNPTQSNPLLESLGGGVSLGRTRIDFSQGSLQQSGNPLDLAIEGDGFFVLAELSEGDTSALVFTRDGRFTQNEDGYLVSSTNGRRVLDSSDRPIRLTGDGPVEIATDGTLRQGGATIAQIQITDVPDRQRLTKGGDGMYLLTSDAAQNRADATGQIRQGALEASSVSDVSALMKIQSAASDARANAGMIRYHNEMMGQVISRIGRTA